MVEPSSPELWRPMTEDFLDLPRRLRCHAQWGKLHDAIDPAYQRDLDARPGLSMALGLLTPPRMVTPCRILIGTNSRLHKLKTRGPARRRPMPAAGNAANRGGVKR
jgi:hypothetical protein